MELGVVRLDGESCAKLFDGMVEIALLQVGDAQVLAEGCAFEL